MEQLNLKLPITNRQALSLLKQTPSRAPVLLLEAAGDKSEASLCAIRVFLHRLKKRINRERGDKREELLNKVFRFPSRKSPLTPGAATTLPALTRPFPTNSLTPHAAGTSNQESSQKLEPGWQMQVQLQSATTSHLRNPRNAEQRMKKLRETIRTLQKKCMASKRKEREAMALRKAEDLQHIRELQEFSERLNLEIKKVQFLRISNLQQGATERLLLTANGSLARRMSEMEQELRVLTQENAALKAGFMTPTLTVTAGRVITEEVRDCVMSLLSLSAAT